MTIEEKLKRIAASGALEIIVEHLEAVLKDLRDMALRTITTWDEFNERKGAERMLRQRVEQYTHLIKEAKVPLDKLGVERKEKENG